MPPLYVNRRAIVLSGVALALLGPAVLYWLALVLYLAGRTALGEVLLQRVPDAWQIAAMFAVPLLGAAFGVWAWRRAPTPRARLVGQCAAIGGGVLAVMCVLAVLRPS